MQARDFREPMRQTELELIVETIPDAVAVVDSNGRITFVNRAAEKVLGLSRREICARTYNAPEWKIATVDGKPYPEGELPFDLVMREGKPVYDVELSMEHPDGARAMLSVNATPIRDARGTIIAAAHSFTDITKRKLAESALQETLLSVPARIEGIEFGHLYHPATEAARIGGDFYDIFTLKEGKVGISVGDISGTGVQAAILASMAKNAIRAYAYEDSSPAQVMAKTNELIRGTMGTGLFVTAIFGILDISNGQLIYCSAGHPPAILKRKTLEAELLITSSPTLGAFLGLNFIDDEATLGVGDTVVLYTDGVTEARCTSGELFGEEQLVGLMKSLPTPISIKGIPKTIFNAVTECTGGTITDDIVVLSFGLENR